MPKGPECGNCGVCPLVGRCPLRPTAIKFESPVRIVTGVGEITRMDDKIPLKGFYLFRPFDGVKPVSPEKKCSICGEKSGCTHKHVL